MRVYARKFDWDEARRLREQQKWTYAQIALHLGVTDSAVRRVVIEGEAERLAEYSRLLAATGRCDDCGGPMNHLSRYRGSRRCKPCADIAKVKVNEHGDLYCFNCDSWKPPEAFYRNLARPTRGVSSECRACSNTRRQRNREANRERERAYTRERRRRMKLP